MHISSQQQIDCSPAQRAHRFSFSDVRVHSYSSHPRGRPREKKNSGGSAHTAHSQGILLREKHVQLYFWLNSECWRRSPENSLRGQKIRRSQHSLTMLASLFSLGPVWVCAPCLNVCVFDCISTLDSLMVYWGLIAVRYSLFRCVICLNSTKTPAWCFCNKQTL